MYIYTADMYIFFLKVFTVFPRIILPKISKIPKKTLLSEYNFSKNPGF